jgi:hypothetical protein
MVENLTEYRDEDIPIIPASFVTIDGELAIHATADDYFDVPVAAAVSPVRSCSCSSNNGSTISAASAVYVIGSEDTSSVTSLPFQAEDSSSSNGDEHRDTEMLASCSDEEDDPKVLSSGAAGAILGLLLGGPFLSLVCGLGALYYSQQVGATGDVARALGDVAVLARSKFTELDEKHHLVDKSKEAATNAFAKLKEAERRHHNNQRCKTNVEFKKFVALCWKSLLIFERKHKVVERISTTMKEHLDKLLERYLPDEEQSSTPNPVDQ